MTRTASDDRSARTTAIRLFITSWILFVVHFAPNVVREIYPALSIGDHLSFRVDEYANMHPDLFETPGRGWHIGNNPGASMLAAIPYAASRPAIDAIVRATLERRADGVPPEYGSPWPMAREFYAAAWRRGLDVKLGLAAFVVQAFCMAVTSALAVVLMFHLLLALTGSRRRAIWLAVLYAIGTPVLYRTGFLNHNLMLGHLAFLGFVGLWNPDGVIPWTPRARWALAGLAAGGAVLFDYSGAIFGLALFVYCVARARDAGEAPWRAVLAFAAGAALPIGLLWFYQWASFGNPFLPGQHWMPPVEWSDLGYQGYGFPQLELLWALALDHRFGLFVACPLLLLGIAYPLLARRGERVLPRREWWAIVLTFAALWVFFAGSNYTRLQFNTGMRYLAPIVPFLYLPAALALVRLSPAWRLPIVGGSVLLAWAPAMYRDVESGLGLARPVIRLLTAGFDLPVLQSLSYLDPSAYGGLVPERTSPLGIFAVAALSIWITWTVGGRPSAAAGSGGGTP